MSEDNPFKDEIRGQEAEKHAGEGAADTEQQVFTQDFPVPETHGL